MAEVELEGIEQKLLRKEEMVEDVGEEPLLTLN